MGIKTLSRSKTVALGLLHLGFSLHVLADDLRAELAFEAGSDGAVPNGWGGGPLKSVTYDTSIVHSGTAAGRIERTAETEGEFSTLTKSVLAAFSGDSIKIRGFLRTESVEGFAGLWLRVDGFDGTLEFDNMRDSGISGSSDWTEYSITLPLVAEARTVHFGALLAGQGTAWVDDLQLLVNGVHIADAPRRALPDSVLELDTEFIDGTGISSGELSPTKVQNLFILGKVWGFLKYHLPAVARGEHHWDFELFRILPEVLHADSVQSGQKVLLAWIQEVGVPEACNPCAEMPTDPFISPDFAWINDAEFLGPELSEALQVVYRNRFSGDTQFYVALEGIGVPRFRHELSYPSQVPPDAGYRMLSLFRLWNIIEYWSPYRDLIDENWDSVLKAFLPRFMSADGWDSYRVELLALITRIDDGHANLWSAVDVRPPLGECHWPVALRYVEGQMVVVRRSEIAETFENGLRIGDIVLKIDDRTVEDLIRKWSPYYSASNASRRMYEMALFFSRGECGRTPIEILRDGQPIVVSETRTQMPKPLAHAHDRSGNAFQLISPEVAYLKLSSAKKCAVDDYLERAKGTKGWIIDIRGYPAESIAKSLASRFVSKPTDIARFTVGSINNPGTFVWTNAVSLEPKQPRYGGTIVVLTDESSVSASEYAAMAFRSASNSVVIGSTTAGADGNVARISLPGRLRTAISGIGVFYPDGEPTQRVGIVPDIEVRPTVEGIRQGRDEVLEAAVKEIIGTEINAVTLPPGRSKH